MSETDVAALLSNSYYDTMATIATNTYIVDVGDGNYDTMVTIATNTYIVDVRDGCCSTAKSSRQWTIGVDWSAAAMCDHIGQGGVGQDRH